MLTPLLLAIPTIVLPALLGSPARDCRFERIGDPAADAQAIGRFEMVVNDYADLHRRLERAWPPLWFISDLERVESVATEFRVLLHEARPQAGEGSFFTPDVADVFRFRLAKVLRQQNLELGDLAVLGEEENTNRWWTPVVNQPLLWGGTTFWPVFEPLPALPLELEYRLIGASLVLLDVRANLVLDILNLEPCGN